jgi:hypothetical protein
MSSWSSYPSIFAMGHRAIKDLLTVEVNVEEKVDGSQFSFGLVPVNAEVDPVYKTIDGVDHALKIRSKGAVMLIEAPEKMFNAAAETVKRLADQLTPGWTYRGEYLARPKHNSLAYDRVPVGNIILFDVTTGEQEYLSYEDKAREAERLGLEVVPLLFSGKVDRVEQFRAFLTNVSILGGQAIEGVVVKPKNYDLFGTDKKVLLGKFVSEAFKEVHRKAWGESNPSNKDIIQKIGDEYCTPARWNKAIQHLREAGRLVEDVQDIGPIIKEIPTDVLKECEDEIKDKLFGYAWPHIRRALTRGFPEYYKDLLLRRSFETNDEQEPVREGGDVRVDDMVDIIPNRNGTTDIN